MLNHGAMGGTTETQFDDWETPPEVFARYHKFFKFTIDAAASVKNAKLPNYWTKEDDALKQDWLDHTVWCNPPYSMKELFLEKAHSEKKAKTVLLLPNATDTDWWHEWSQKSEVLLIKGRIQYLIDGQRPKRVCKKTGKMVSTSNSKGSCLFIFGPWTQVGEIFRDPF